MAMLTIRILETVAEMEQHEALQRLVWPGSETDILPVHLLITLAHNGGLVLGAYEGDKMVGLLVGFPGLDEVPDGPRPKHCSHELGVHPQARDTGIGLALKRAQWQFVRQQGLDRITWTYDPLLSRNAHLNIARLGAVCNTYLREVYGEMRDGLNAGLASDRFQVDWWINTRRVERRLSHTPRPQLSLADYAAANVQVLSPTRPNGAWIAPPLQLPSPEQALLLAEIPPDFGALKAADFALARAWRDFSRELFETCFAGGYLITDFIYETNGVSAPRSFYVFTHGESSLRTV